MSSVPLILTVMRLVYHVFSECGARASNQDRVAVLQMKQRSLFVLCDGVGSLPDSHIAAEFVCTNLAAWWGTRTGWADCVGKVREACRKVYMRLGLKRARMGTTMVMAAVEDDVLTVGWCGDSRCYVYRPGFGPVFVTSDHRALGGAERGPLLHGFFTYGGADRAVPDVHRLVLRRGDTVLLSSDGLHDALEPAVLEGLLAGKQPVADLCRCMADLCRGHSLDNFTGVVIRVYD